MGRGCRSVPASRRLTLNHCPTGQFRAYCTYAYQYLHLKPTMSVATQSQPGAPAGIKSYYQAKIETAEVEINQKTQNLRRLEAQRNALNARGARSQSYTPCSALIHRPVRLLREELQLLHEPGSYVGEVIKVMGKSKVLVKVQPEGKYSWHSS